MLSRIITEFECHSPSINEGAFHAAAASTAQLACTLATEKASVIASAHPDAIIIGSDQVADLDGRVLGKPETIEVAAEQLGALSGKWHRLLTAVCVTGGNRQHLMLNETRLKMRSLSTQEIARYLSSDTPFDCAGSYRIESAGIALFEKIECDDFTAIIGLPLITLADELRFRGFRIP